MGKLCSSQAQDSGLEQPPHLVSWTKGVMFSFMSAHPWNLPTKSLVIPTLETERFVGRFFKPI